MGGPLGDPGEVRKPPGGPGGVERPTRMSWWGRVSHPEVREVWEAHPVVLVGSRGPYGGPGGVSRPTQRFRRG